MRLQRLLGFAFAAASLLGQEAPRPSPFRPFKDIFGPGAAWPPTSIIKAPLKRKTPAPANAIVPADSPKDQTEESNDDGLLLGVGVPKITTLTPASDATPLAANIAEVTDANALPPNVITQQGVGDPPAYTYIEGNISGIPQDGKKYTAQCIDQNCLFLVEEKNGAGKSMIESYGEVILTTIDQQGTGTISTASLKDRGTKHIYVQLSNKEHTYAGSCTVGEVAYISIENGRSVRKTGEGITGCDPLQPEDHLSSNTIADLFQDTLDLCKIWVFGRYDTPRSLEDHRPSRPLDGPEVIEQFTALTDEYNNDRRSYFRQAIKFLAKKLRFDAKEFSLR